VLPDNRVVVAADIDNDEGARIQRVVATISSKDHIHSVGRWFQQDHVLPVSKRETESAGGSPDMGGSADIQQDHILSVSERWD
jgi:hypothetical protein